MSDFPLSQLAESGETGPSALPPSSLIIGTRDRPAFLYDTVTSVLDGDEVPSEIIIVDQSRQRNDQLASLTTERDCMIRYLWTSSIGLSKANNLGAEVAETSILVFTHDDVRVERSWYGAIVRALLAFGDRSVVSGRVLPDKDSNGGAFVLATKTSETYEAYQGRIDTNVLYPFNMACYREALKDVGGFDERLGPGTRFPAAEDNDLGYRFLESGFQIHYVPDATLYHLAWRPVEDFARLWWSYGRGQGAFYAKYFSLGDTYMIRRMCRELLFNVRCGLRHLTNWQGRQSEGKAAYVSGMISGACEWMLVQRFRTETRRRAVAEGA